MIRKQGVIAASRSLGYIDFYLKWYRKEGLIPSLLGLLPQSKFGCLVSNVEENMGRSNQGFSMHVSFCP